MGENTVLQGSHIDKDTVQLLGSNNLIHHKVSIKGNVRIGSNNIINENTIIHNTHPHKTLTIGDNNVFEVACHFQGIELGSYNVLSCKTHIKPNSILKDHITLAPKCIVHENEVVPSHTTIWGANNQRRTVIKEHVNKSTHERHLAYLKDVLPKYHHLADE